MIESSKEKEQKIKKKDIKEISLKRNDNGQGGVYEEKIRPAKLDEIIGRETEKQALRMMINSAKKRKESVDHILFYGPPGLGKTTFAMAIANEVGSSIKITSGPAIERQGDLAAILTGLKKNDILFIDEIHRLAKTIEEVLYPVMEDGMLDIVMGKGPSAKTIRLGLEPFTLIGATTQIGKISSPMRDRFGLIQRLDFFSEDDLKSILARATKLWDIDIDDDALSILAGCSRGTARIGLRLLRRCRDYAESKNMKVINTEVVLDTIKLLGVDREGLERIDRVLLKSLLTNFGGGPIGLSTLAASISEDVVTISEVYEPFLMKQGFIQRTSRGRVLTEKGLKYVDLLNNE